MTKREQERTARANIRSYRNSTCYELWDAYGRCSVKKREAWEYCKRLCREFEGEDLKVISYNTYMFTAGFMYADPKTGELMFMYISPSYNQPVSMAIE